MKRTCLRVAIAIALLFVIRPVPVVPQATNYSLTINLAGPNSGTVGVVPSGLLCSSPTPSCTVSIAAGSAVRVVANGSAGGNNPPGALSGGTGSASACATTTCSFTINANSTVTVTFDNANGPFLTVTTLLAGDGQGEVGVDNSRRQNFDPATFSTAATSYAAGSVVSMTATAAPESRFSGYSGGTNGAATCGAASSCSFTLTANASVTATFHAMTAISVEPPTAAIFIGRTQDFSAKGTFSNGVTEGITSIGMGVWRTRAQMTTARFSLAAAAAGGRVYAIGGIVGQVPGGSVGSPSAIVEAFDPAANAWSAAASLATPREGLGAATVNNLIYAVGGNTSGSFPVAVVERYDPATNTWTARAPLAAPRRFLTAAALNGIVYAIGGETSAGVVGTVEAYDPATNTWSTRAPMKTARAMPAAAAAGGFLFVTGGSDAGGHVVGSVERYDAATDTWAIVAALPEARSALAGASADGVVYAVGGQTATVQSAATAYDAVRNQWALKSGMPTSRTELAATTLGGIVYAIGGLAGTGASLKTIEAFTDAVRWSSSNTTVATITQSSATASGVAAGQSTITATIGGLTCAAANACGAVSVTRSATTLALDRTSFSFGATSDAGVVVSSTAPQTLHMSQSGGGVVTWTATSNQPWLRVSPQSGQAPAILSVSVVAGAAVPASGTVTGAVAFTVTGSDNTIGPVAVTLTVTPKTAPPSAPFGSFDTPAGDATVLAGSIALTGWTLDNVGVKQVELWRNLQPGETTPPGNSTAGDPRNGKIFIATATFVDNARPDVEALNPTVPANYRAGWGYLMLTWGLFGQGNGTYRFYAFGVDQEGNTATIGAKTVIISNNAATRPFGSIDTPAIGGDASGPNFGWGLTPKVNGAATCKIQPSGVQYSIDSGPLQPAVYGDARTDIAGAFPGFSNTAAAGGHAIIDWTALTNGSHTIGWLITDDCNRADGVGSRFFNVTTGTSLVAAATPEFRLRAETSSSAHFRLKAEATQFDSEPAALTLTRGYNGGSELVGRGEDGAYAIEVKQGERIELRTPRDFDAAVQIAPDNRERALPIGSRWDAASNTFYWQPAPVFLGRFHISFSNGRERISVRIVVTKAKE